MWFDRLLMLIEVLLLLYMVKLDRINQMAISRFLEERTKWYARRALQKSASLPEQLPTATMENKKAPETDPVPSEIVTVMRESEDEQLSENS